MCRSIYSSFVGISSLFCFPHLCNFIVVLKNGCDVYDKYSLSIQSHESVVLFYYPFWWLQPNKHRIELCQSCSIYRENAFETNLLINNNIFPLTADLFNENKDHIIVVYGIHYVVGIVHIAWSDDNLC